MTATRPPRPKFGKCNDQLVKRCRLLSRSVAQGVECVLSVQLKGSSPERWTQNIPPSSLFLGVCSGSLHVSRFSQSPSTAAVATIGRCPRLHLAIDSF